MASIRPRRSRPWPSGCSGSSAPCPRGIQVGPTPPLPGPIERRKRLGDALRLQLWRATGSTGGWLAPERAASKLASCGL